MDSSTYSRPLHLFSILTAFGTLCLIAVGGLVTSHGAGMAVPDWPNTYGYNMFFFPVSQWVGGIFYEHTHRLLASLVGLLMAGLSVWLWVRETHGRVRGIGVAAVSGVILLLGIRQLPVYYTLAAGGSVTIVVGLILAARTGWSLRWLGMVGFAAVVLQGVLGGLRVVWTQDELGIVHATLAQAFLLLLGVIGLRTSRLWFTPALLGSPWANTGSARRLLLITTLLILAQLVLGATMRHQHAGLAIPDFPLAYGSVWPDMSAEAVARHNQQRIETVALNPITGTQIGLQMGHRLMAVTIVGLVVWCGLAVRKAFPHGHEMRRLAGFWVVLIGIQFGLGVWTIWSNKAADVASMHVVCGALSLVTGGLMCVISARLREGVVIKPPENQTDLNASLMGNEAGAAAK